MVGQNTESVQIEHKKESGASMNAAISGNPTPEKDILGKLEKQATQEAEERKVKPEDLKTASQAEIEAEAEKLRAALKVINTQKAKLSQQRRDGDAKKLRCAGVGLYLLAHDRKKFDELLERPNFIEFIRAQDDKELDKQFDVKREKAS